MGIGGCEDGRRSGERQEAEAGAGAVRSGPGVLALERACEPARERGADAGVGVDMVTTALLAVSVSCCFDLG